MCCGGSRGRVPGKRGSGWVQESAEHVPPEVLWSLSGIRPPRQPLGQTPISPMPRLLWARHHYDHLYREAWPPLCHSRVHKQTAQTHTGLIPCHYVDSSSPLGLVIPSACSVSGSLLASDGESGRRCLLICPHTCMWFGNTARDCCPSHSYSPDSEPASPFLGNVLPHSLDIGLFVAHVQLFTSLQCVFLRRFWVRMGQLCKYCFILKTTHRQFMSEMHKNCHYSAIWVQYKLISLFKTDRTWTIIFLLIIKAIDTYGIYIIYIYIYTYIQHKQIVGYVALGFWS